jgi:hypothetical protein
VKAPRPIALLSAALLMLGLLGAGSAAAKQRGHRHAHARTGLSVGIGAARVVKRAKWRRRAEAAQRRRRQAAAKAKKAAADPTRPLPPGVLFRGDFDDGFGQWYVQSLDSRATLFSSGAFQGSQAARFEVRDGDVEPDTGSERSEVSGPTFDEGDDLYIRDAIRVPGSSSYSGPWQIVEQLHEESWSGSPGMALFLDADGSLTLGPGDGSQTFWQSEPLGRDRWYELVYRVDLSRNPDDGFVEVWLDGVQQAVAGGGTRAYGQTIQAAQTYLKAGVYRSKSSTGTSLVEHDAIVVGTSYAAVAGV